MYFPRYFPWTKCSPAPVAAAAAQRFVGGDAPLLLLGSELNQFKTWGKLPCLPIPHWEATSFLLWHLLCGSSIEWGREGQISCSVSTHPPPRELAYVCGGGRRGRGPFRVPKRRRRRRMPVLFCQTVQTILLCHLNWTVCECKHLFCCEEEKRESLKQQVRKRTNYNL